MEKTNYHMSPEEFRRRGREAVDWIADYMERVEEFPVLSQVEPGWVRRQLPDHPPLQPESFDSVMADLKKIVLPAITHWQSPNFFAFFPSNASGPSVLGELFSAGLGVQGMLWATSPACTELETHVLDWLVEMLDLPPAFRSTHTGGGVIQDTASSATLCALLAARERATQRRSNIEGVSAGQNRLTAYCSDQAHSSVEKAVRIAGLGSAHLRQIGVDSAFALRADELARQIAEDRATGFRPIFVCATIGTTSSNAIDPLGQIGEICRQHDVWLHVDAAMSGTAALCPEFRWIHEGLELADSYCFNPHKWMFVNFDCDCFYVADRSALLDALSILPEYLRNQASEEGAVIDYRDWQIPLGRRFRALKLWLVIRHYGIEGLRHHVREHVRLTQDLVSRISDHPQLVLAAPTPLNLVCFRHRDGDNATQRIMDELNASGRLYLTHTRLDDHLTLRLSIGQRGTEQCHIDQAWQKIEQAVSIIEQGE